jgi:hypothetical protein
MTTLIMAVCLTAQYPTPQVPQYVPSQAVYAMPAPIYAAPQIAPAGPFGQFLGHIGMQLVKHSWPRVQPIAAAPAPSVAYVQVQQPVMQAVYTVPTPQAQYVPPVGVPLPPAKSPPPAYGTPQQPGYGSPQQPAYNAPKPSESVPPVPNR